MRPIVIFDLKKRVCKFPLYFWELKYFKVDFHDNINVWDSITEGNLA
jgi:hypothetical protein